MYASSRRRFLVQLGRGMMVASIGSTLAADMGLAPAQAGEEPGNLDFGSLEPLVDLLQSTPADKLLPAVVGKLKAGVSLKELVAAGGLANARAFGGEDYIGFHTLMALGPALAMSREMPTERAALPVLKVLYRNTSRLQETGGATHDALAKVTPGELPAGGDYSQVIRDAVHRGDREAAERTLAAATARDPDFARNALLTTVEEGTDVHRVVLMHRAWDMVSIVGREQAETMLRQSLRYCLKNEKYSLDHYGGLRKVLPQTLDKFKLHDQAWGTKEVDDKWVADFVQTLFTVKAEQAAEAVAAAIAEGIMPQRILEAVSLTANQLVLRDGGRTAKQVQPGKPEGSVHGDSIGVHASDTANAWRNIAQAGDWRHRNAAVILAGYQVAQDRTERGGDFQTWQPRPWKEQLEKVTSNSPDELLAQLEAAVRENDQARACAVVAHIGDQRQSEIPVFKTLLQFAASEDGALHAEKYYRTVSEDFQLTRPAFRWRHLVALARVTASEFGKRAPGYDQACTLLGVG